MRLARLSPFVLALALLPGCPDPNEDVHFAPIEDKPCGKGKAAKRAVGEKIPCGEVAADKGVLETIEAAKKEAEPPREADQELVAEAPAAPDPADKSHPDYPTARLAGTEDIFFLEEPDRGPWLKEVEAPKATGPWRWHAACEDAWGDLACGPALETRPAEGYRSAPAGEGVTLVERYEGTHLEGSWIATRDAEGRLLRLVALDRDGDVDLASFYDPPGERFSSRELDGANALPGCGYRKLDRDAAGRVTRVTCLSWLGEPMKDTSGVAQRKLVRGPHGLVIESRALDAKGEPTRSHDGVHRIATTRDAEGRVLERRHFDLAGQPALSSGSGCHGTQWIRSEGRVVEQRCLGPEGKPGQDHEELFARRYEHDARGCVVRETYLGADGKPTPSRSGPTAVELQVDERCRTLRHRCLDAGGRATPCGPHDPAEYRYTYKDGWIASTRHYDATGKPTAGPVNEVFEVRYVRDALGRQLRRSCHDEAGAPVECASTGFHAANATYDDAGRETETTFEDTEGKRTTNLSTWLRRRTYDAYDHVYEVQNLDAGGKLLESFGAASMRYLYDEGHRLFAMLLYDAQGDAARYRACFTGKTCPSNPWHAVRIVRSESGQVTQNLYFDAERQLIKTLDCRSERCWR